MASFFRLLSHNYFIRPRLNVYQSHLIGTVVNIITVTATHQLNIRKDLSSCFFNKVNYCVDSAKMNLKLLNQEEATNIDQELFNRYQFSVDQLMELAGLSCAHAISKEYAADPKKKVLIIAGPGNNGGDGLVCSRHLKLLNYDVAVFYPRPVDKPLFNNLVQQCNMYDIPFLDGLPAEEGLVNDYFLIVDALFGFSFKPPVRPQFAPVLQLLSQSSIPIVSVDIPSGWHVENGPDPADSSNRISPDMLVSLTAPKLCSKYFKGRFHYLGGRFVPPKLQERYNLNLPPYPGTDQVVLLEQRGK